MLGATGALPLLVSLACVPPDEQRAQPAKVPVATEIVETVSFRPNLTLFGRVEPSTTVALQTPAAGTLIYAPRFARGLRTGESVRAGEPLFEVRNEDLALRRIETRLQKDHAETELDRAQRGFDAGFLPEAELRRRQVEADLARERLANAEIQAEDLSFVASVDGYLMVDDKIAPGTEVAAQTVVGYIAGHGRPRIEGFASASDLGRLQPDLEVECLRPGSERLVGRGRIREVGKQVDRSGTVRLVIEVTEDLGVPVAGEGLELRVLLDERMALAVPRTSLLTSSGISALFVLDPRGDDLVARRRLVQLGPSDGERVEILDGLRAGERIAVQGVEFLSDGAAAVDAGQESADGAR